MVKPAAQVIGAGIRAVKYYLCKNNSHQSNSLYLKKIYYFIWSHVLITLDHYHWAMVQNYLYRLRILVLIIVIINIIIIIIIIFSCHRSFQPGTSLETTVIPTVQVSSFTLQYFPYCV
jgi:hypothetical protein